MKTKNLITKGTGLSNSVSQLNEVIEELRSQIRELRDRVAILEIGAGETADTTDSSDTTSTARSTVRD